MKLAFPNSFDYVKQDLDNLGTWEKRTTEYFKKILKPGQLFADVGAQVGYFTVMALDLGADVLAFEPSNENRQFLYKNTNNTTDIKHCRIFSQALSNRAGEVKLYTGKTPGENSIVENYHVSNKQNYKIVPTVRFDDLQLDIPDVVKIDVEGAEKMVLEGMQSFLTATKPITLILEDWQGEVSDWLVKEYDFKVWTTDRVSGNYILVKNQEVKYEEEPIRCHLLGTFNAPNTLADEGIGNAFGTKVINMAKILKKLGHYVIFYGVEGSEVECDEFVQVSTKEVLEKEYGKWDKTKIYKEKFNDVPYNTFRDNCVTEINKRKRNGDFLLLCHGSFQKDIANAVKIPATIEIGIGHRSSFAKHRIFESEFQRAWTYGTEGIGDGSFYDCVIPGFFDPKDFQYSEAKDDYFLYLGRVISKKGIFVAQQVCEKLNKKLIVAGFGYNKEDNAVDAKAFEDLLKLPNVEYVGFAGKEKRKELMSRAKALFLPTLYLEPFGYVVLEAGLSGTPVITTDFGAFPETVKQGYSGYRCRMFHEFVEAVQNIDKIKPANCRKWAMNFTIDKAAEQYKRYFSSILDFSTKKGWYA